MTSSSPFILLPHALGRAQVKHPGVRLDLLSSLLLESLDSGWCRAAGAGPSSVLRRLKGLGKLFKPSVSSSVKWG